MLSFSEKREYLLTVLLRAESLTPTEKIVALAMAFKIDENGNVDLRIRELAVFSSLNPRSVRRAIMRLREKINLEVRVEGKKNIYRFIQWSSLAI
tara:strand:+ start:664 stop:948 length:285 start_codon:yes stop_codon:yes gene_type:complete